MTELPEAVAPRWRNTRRRAVIAFASSSPVATLAGTVMVPAGATSARFNALTSQVSYSRAPTQVAMAEHALDATRSRSLRIDPRASLRGNARFQQLVGTF